MNLTAELAWPKGQEEKKILKVRCFKEASWISSKGAFVIFFYLGFNVAFNTVQVISRQVVGRAEETST